MHGSNGWTRYAPIFHKVRQTLPRVTESAQPHSDRSRSLVDMASSRRKFFVVAVVLALVAPVAVSALFALRSSSGDGTGLLRTRDLVSGPPSQRLRQITATPANTWQPVAWNESPSDGKSPVQTAEGVVPPAVQAQPVVKRAIPPRRDVGVGAARLQNRRRLHQRRMYARNRNRCRTMRRPQLVSLSKRSELRERMRFTRASRWQSTTELTPTRFLRARRNPSLNWRRGRRFA